MVEIRTASPPFTAFRIVTGAMAIAAARITRWAWRLANAAKAATKSKVGAVTNDAAPAARPAPNQYRPGRAACGAAIASATAMS